MKVKFPCAYAAYIELSWRDLLRLILNGWIRDKNGGARIDLGESK